MVRDTYSEEKGWGFQHIQTNVESLHGRKIKCLQSSNGKKYWNELFDAFLKENGIGRKTTITYTSEQNGVAERRNLTLMDMTRWFLAQSSLSPSFLGEAINTANYVQNQCPSKSLGGKTAHEIWTGKAQDVSHFKEFEAKVSTRWIELRPRENSIPDRKEDFSSVTRAKTKDNGRRLTDEKRIDSARDVKFVGSPSESPEIDKFDEIWTEEENNPSHIKLTLPTRNTRNPVPENEENDQEEFEEPEDEIERRTTPKR